VNQVCIVGAGFSGAVIAHELACAGYKCDVFEARPHVAGNCFTERAGQSGVMVHRYGPHIFHTDNERVWNYVRRFDEFVSFTNRVKAIANQRVYTLPINLLTINQFFGKAFTPAEAKAFIESMAEQAEHEPISFEEQALRFIGPDLYEAFFKGYTLKQWGVHPRELPASILKRLPVRFNYDDNYYTSRFQGIPRNGYTTIVEKLLDHSNITLTLNKKVRREDCRAYDRVFYTGPLDEWFTFSEGRLAYRTLDFQEEWHAGDYQGNAVINYCDRDVPWTRICEHKHFSPWESHDATVIYKEYSRACGENDIPFYPVRLVDDKQALERYQRLAQEEPRITFVGRLATYRYLDMDIAIEEALIHARRFINESKNVIN